jgi:phage tail-like protein
MARPKSSDYLHNFRFHVLIQGFGGSGTTQLRTGGTPLPSAGFNACTAPEATQGAVEYREGHYIYTRKFSGLPSMNDITLSRGVALADGTFWAWMKSVMEGNEEYRADVSIIHFHRDGKPGTSTTPGAPNTIHGIPASEGYIEYKLGEALPVRHKVSTDLDATGAEVSIKEIDLSYEWFDVIDHGASTATAQPPGTI